MLPIQFFAAPALSCSICKQTGVSLWASAETGVVFVCSLPKQMLPVALLTVVFVFSAATRVTLVFCSEYEGAQAVSRISCPEQFWQIFCLRLLPDLLAITVQCVF
jgi:hypothetical protein